MIADGNGVESLAGIMGGEASGCSETTTDVLIESALWEPLNIAQTGRKLGINSDARYRFERGVDPDFMLPGLELATQMVLDLCGGTPSAVTVAGKVETPKHVIDFPLAEVPRLAGLSASLPEVKRVLERLGFGVAGQGETLKITVPSWRPDVHGKADIVEEIVRILGVDRVPATPFDRGDAPRKPILTSIQMRTRKAKRALAARGMVEAVTWSFVRQAAGRTVRRRQARTGARQSDRRPICRTCGRACCPACWRPRSATPTAASPTWRCSRSGRSFAATGRRTSATAASGVRRALAKANGSGRHWSSPVQEVDAFDAKADALAVLAAAGAPVGGDADRAGRPRLVSSGPQRHDSDRPAERARPFRRTASARAWRRSRPRARWSASR